MLLDNLTVLSLNAFSIFDRFVVCGKCMEHAIGSRNVGQPLILETQYARVEYQFYSRNRPRYEWLKTYKKSR